MNYIQRFWGPSPTAVTTVKKASKKTECKYMWGVWVYVNEITAVQVSVVI